MQPTLERRTLTRGQTSVGHGSHQLMICWRDAKPQPTRQLAFDMDENTAHAFVNRDESVPLLASSGTAGSPSPDPESKRSRLRESISNSKLKDKLQDGASSRSETGFSLQDRLLTK